MHSPLHQFRAEVTDGFTRLNDRLTAIEAAAAAARVAERAKSAAKGVDFEDLLEAMLGDIARGPGDLVERTGTAAGDVIRSKKGDFVLTVNPAHTAGAELRIVIEAKDRAMSVRQMRDEIRAAKTNRGGRGRAWSCSPRPTPRAGSPRSTSAPATSTASSTRRRRTRRTFEAAIRLARLLALVSTREREVEVDAPAVKAALDGVREQLDLIKGLKSTLTSIGNELAGRRRRPRPAPRRGPRPGRRGRGGAPPGRLRRNGFDTSGAESRVFGASIPCYPRGPHRG